MANQARIEDTLFAGPYRSQFLEMHGHLQPLLGHLNCSFFSSKATAPNLLELKQHAQALLVVIKHLTVPNDPTEIDNEDRNMATSRGVQTPSARSYSQAHDTEINKAMAWDFLADLTEPYNNSNPSHHLALTGLLNILDNQGQTDHHGRSHCPLHLSDSIRDHDAQSRSQQALPYAETWNLIKHADELLSRLDHEFASEGGILGILPIDDLGNDESTNINLLGRRSILGQWIAYTRALVLRTHELQNNLQETLSIVSGEAVVPKLMLAQTPVDERAAHGLAQTEDWIISLDMGKLDELKHEFAQREITVFDPALHDVGSGEGNQDLITVDVTTRYSRLRQGNTIFISPGVIQPEQLRPGVVQVVKGVWPTRCSLWEEKNRAEMERLRHIEQHDLPSARNEAQSRKQAIEVMSLERKSFLLNDQAIPRGIVNGAAEQEQLRIDLMGEETRLFNQELKRRELELAVRERQFAVDREAFERVRREADEFNLKQMEAVRNFHAAGGQVSGEARENV